MLIPRYWSEHKQKVREGDRRATILRFGWSETDQAAADAHAVERTAEAVEQFRAGQDIYHREDRVPYNGADGLPIREEILETHLDGDAIVTRNSYGARCLNVGNVLFADVDHDRIPVNEVVGCALLAFGAVAGLSFALRLDAPWLLVLVAPFLGAFAGGAAFAGLLGVESLWRNARGGPMSSSHRRLRRFVQKHPEWRLRIYETPRGLRALAMHRTFHPVDDWPEIKAFFRAIEGDRTYETMCKLQRCFRARVSPKPWRIGIEKHLRPRPGVWPVKTESMPLREEWVARYEERARGVASCRFRNVMGSGTIDETAARVRDLHDELSGALVEGAEVA